MRTVQIEKVPNLKTYSCLSATMRFIARRSKPKTIIIKHGTDFFGAKREFAEYNAAWNYEGIDKRLA